MLLDVIDRVAFGAFLALGWIYSPAVEHLVRRNRQMDAVYLGIVVIFFALCFGMVHMFEKIRN